MSESKSSDRDSFDAGDPIRELLDDLSDRFSKWSRLVVWMTSNRLFSSRDGSTLNISKGELDIVFNCVDLSYYKSLLTDRRVSEITISTEIPALKSASERFVFIIPLFFIRL